MTTDTGASLETDHGPATTTSTGDAGAKERAQQAASTAADESRHVAAVAADEARGVAAEATAQARDLIGEAQGHLRSQVDAQGRTAKDQLAGTLSSLSNDLGSMAENGSGLAADLAHEVSQRAGSLARHLEGRQPQELLDDVRRFARRRPGTFLLGALTAGVVVGRLGRGAKDAIDAAEAGAGTSGSGETTSVLTDPPQVTPGAPDTASVHATHGQPTQPPVSPDMPTTGSATPPAGTDLGTFTTGSPTSGGLTS